MNNKKNICFYSHNATRTGAPIVLYHFVKWIQENRNNTIEVWFGEGGEMLKEFQSVCTCRVLPPLMEKGLLKRGLKKIFSFSGRKQALKKLQEFDLVFFNTASSLSLMHLLPENMENKMVLWLHEQPLSISMWYKKMFISENLLKFKKIFCVSSQTKKWLQTEFKISEKNISIVYPFVETSLLRMQQQANKKNNTFIVGGCGLQDWRKGADLFLQVAQYINKHFPVADIKFVWVGAESSMTMFLEYQLQKLDLMGKVTFTGEVKDSGSWFSLFDVFLMTSREDPFPLVVLEAAMHNKPVICFDKIGDITKVVQAVPDNVIPFLDTEAMAHRIMYYNQSNDIIQKDGEIINREAQLFAIDKCAPSFYSQLEKSSIFKN